MSAQSGGLYGRLPGLRPHALEVRGCPDALECPVTEENFLILQNLAPLKSAAPGRCTLRGSACTAFDVVRGSLHVFQGHCREMQVLDVPTINTYSSILYLTEVF